jgi:AAA15 family ATPase/GTPase
MIVELSIKNFGSIKDRQTLSMEASKDTTLESYYVTKVAGLRLMKMAILYGPNASGKTTVLKGLEFLRDLVIPSKRRANKSETLDFKPFQFENESKNGISEIKIDFIQQDQRFQYTVEFTKTHIVSELLEFYPTKKRALLFSRTTDAENQFSKVQFGDKAGIKSRDAIILEGNTIWNETVLMAFSRSNVNAPYLKIATDFFKETIMPLVTLNTNLTSWAGNNITEKPELRKVVMELLGKADFQVSDFKINHEEIEMDSGQAAQFKMFIKTQSIKSEEITEEKPIRFKKMDLHFQHTVYNSEGDKQNFELDSDDESHGTMRFWGLSTILSVAINNSKVLNIDELETSLHPDLMKHFILIALANTQNSQLIFTTHNVLLLSERDVLRNDAIWFTEKKSDGATELYSAADFDSGTLRTDGSILNAYKLGRLGARPNPGSIFLSTKSTSFN